MVDNFSKVGQGGANFVGGAFVTTVSFGIAWGHALPGKI